mgnify:CR=1 FL=1
MDAHTRREDLQMSDVMNIADIAVLKSEVAGLHDAINEVSTKMDLVLSMRVELSVQGERLEHAVVELGRTRDAVNKDLGILEQRADNLNVHTLNTRKRLDAWLNRIFGGVAVGTLALGLLQYNVWEKLEQLEKLASIVAHNTAQIDLITRAVRSRAIEFDPDVGVEPTYEQEAGK